MEISEGITLGAAAPVARRSFSHGLVSMSNGVLPLLDMLCLIVAAWLGTELVLHWPGAPALAPGVASALTPAAWVAVALAPFLLYDPHFGSLAGRGRIAALLRSHALRFTLFAAVALALGVLAQALHGFARGWLLWWFVLGLSLSSLTRLGLARWVQRLQRRGVLSEVIAVVGAGALAERLVLALREARPETIELLGVFDDEPAQAGTLRPSGSLAQLLELGKTRRIDWILLTLPPTAPNLLSIVQRLKALSVPIGLCPQHVGLALPHRSTDIVADSVSVTLLADRPIKQWDAVSKAGVDWLIGGLVTLLLLPLLAIIALAIRLESPGPIIFKQRRHAQNNREFDIYKFRTMRWNAAASTQDLRQTSRSDQRITPLGRLLRASSLDELPQLFNVLKGDMSLVGPRPHAVNMRTEDRLGHEITELYPQRHRVKPGITGWSQVNGARGATDTTAQLSRRVALDLHYIENWSLLLDLKILALTSREVIKGTNAY